MAAIRLSEATVERIDGGCGRTSRPVVRARAGPSDPAVQWPWHRDAAGRRVAYVTIDATGTRQQGPGGRTAEARMAYVAGVYNPVPADWKSAAAATETAADAGPATSRGCMTWRKWVAAAAPPGGAGGHGGGGVVGGTDRWRQRSGGVPGRQNFARPDLVVILDFYHAASYLEKLAQAAVPPRRGPGHRPGGAVVPAVERRRRSSDVGGAGGTLREWPHAPVGHAEGANWKRRAGILRTTCIGWSTRNTRARGWQIGSGVV